MTEERELILPIVVHSFLMQDDKILLLERANTGYFDGCFSLPGGHVRENESISAAAVREVEEEVKVSVLDLVPCVVMPFPEGVDFLFETRSWTGLPRIGEPELCRKLGWFSIGQLPANTAPFVVKAIELRRKAVWYHEFAT